jgi:transcriptional regulator, AsnC family
MSDLALQTIESGRRLDAIDRKISPCSRRMHRCRWPRSATGSVVLDALLEAIQRLEADGIILRRVALVDQNKIGLGISVFVSVESGDHSDAWLTIRQAPSAPCPR